MRQFLLGKDVAYPTTALSNDSVVDGAIGFYFRKSDKTISPTATGTEITKDCMLIVNRPVDKGGNVVIPIHKNKFSYVKGVYQAGKVFKQVFTIPAPTTIGEYSMIVALKGVGFNQRNKWTASVYIKDVNKTADELAEALAKAINNNTVGSKVVATASEATLTIDGQVVGMDYEVIPADLLTGLAATSTQKGEAAYGDAQYIIDLANKAAADAGYRTRPRAAASSGRLAGQRPLVAGVYRHHQRLQLYQAEGRHRWGPLGPRRERLHAHGGFP